MKERKAPGPDEISAEIIKEVAKTAPKLLETFNALLTASTFSKEWNKATVMLLWKKGRKSSAIRPLCLLNTLGKAYESMTKERLEKKVDDGGGLSANQFGFCKGLPQSQQWKKWLTN